MSCSCGLWIFAFGGWPEECCIWHDEQYRKMYAGIQTLTLDQVDDHFLEMLLYKASTGPYPKLQAAQAHTMYNIAHAYGLIFWKGPR